MRKLRIALVPIAAVATLLVSCVDDTPPPTPGRPIAFTVERYRLPWPRDRNILAAYSEAAVLADYYEMPAAVAEEQCPRRRGDERCFQDANPLAGALWILVFVPLDCSQKGSVASVKQKDSEVFVAVRVVPNSCPPGAGTQADPTMTLVTAVPAAEPPITSVTVAYSEAAKLPSTSTAVRS